VRLWAEALLAALAVIHSALPEGSSPLGGPDLPEVALYLMCQSPVELYTHAHMMRIFTLDYMGEDCLVFTLPEQLGIFRELHDQYAYDAEKRSVYPQMMLNYLLDGLDLIATTDLAAVEEVTAPPDEVESMRAALESDAGRVAVAMAVNRSDRAQSFDLSARSQNSIEQIEFDPSQYTVGEELSIDRPHVGELVIVVGHRILDGEIGYVSGYNPKHSRFEVVLKTGAKLAVMMRPANLRRYLAIKPEPEGVGLVEMTTTVTRDMAFPTTARARASTTVVL